MDDLLDQVRRLREEAEGRERRFGDELRRRDQRVEELERKEAQVNAAFLQFLTVITMLLPEMPSHIQSRVQNGLDRVRQVSGLS